MKKKQYSIKLNIIFHFPFLSAFAVQKTILHMSPGSLLEQYLHVHVGGEISGIAQREKIPSPTKFSKVDTFSFQIYYISLQCVLCFSMTTM